MNRHIHNLERLHDKMRARYGEGDSLVQELKRELDAASGNPAHIRAPVGEHPMTRSGFAMADRQYQGRHGVPTSAAN